MDRPIVYGQESLRSYDLLSGWKDALIGLGFLAQDVNGASTTVVSGLVASQTGPASLSINLSAGRIYQAVVTDATAYGSMALDSDIILQQGAANAQVLTLVTTGLSSGQSRWALIQTQFQQTDAVAADDPTAGIMNFWNAANPSQPFVGPANNNSALNSVRQGIAQVQVVYGAVAATGSEVPPSPSGGFTPLYLIDLAFGQSTITNAQIRKAGPSVGTGVPSNYAAAPFLAGLLNSHHGGVPGQAPKIDLTTEVVNVLPNNNTTNGLQVFTVTGTFTYPAGVYSVEVIVTGGGGSSGSTGTAAQGCAAGGSAGGTAIKRVAATPGTVVAVTVGTGGTAPAASGTANGTNGNAGTTSSFGASCSATGGNGGGGSVSGGVAPGGLSGTGVGGDINIKGGAGQDGGAVTSSAGNGAASYWGGGGRSQLDQVLTNVGAGQAYGSGGGAPYLTSVGRVGQAGAPGVVLVRW